MLVPMQDYSHICPKKVNSWNEMKKEKACKITFVIGHKETSFVGLESGNVVFRNSCTEVIF